MKKNKPNSKPSKSVKRSSPLSQKAKKRTIPGFVRVTTGIPGLDRMLHGGFLKGGTYLLLGAPGTGKTILANQICFHQISEGRRAVYVTLLAESHTRMFGNLKPLAFFEEDRVSNDIQYMSGYSVLEKEGLDGPLRLLRDLIDLHRADVLFIDGVASADALSGSTEQFKKFVHHLNTVLGIAGCTTFLLSSAEGEQTQPEYTMVDGIVKLTFVAKAMKTIRLIEIRKFRGSAHLYGQHHLEITGSGVAVYPRTETVMGLENTPSAPFGARVKFEMEELDQMLNGGLIGGSTTALLGATGAGKTQIGTQFLLAGAKRGEHVVLLALYENPDRMEERLRQMGKSMAAYLKKGALTIIRPETGSNSIDKTMNRLMTELHTHKTKRLFIEGMNGLRSQLLEKDRLNEVMIAVSRELRTLGVTTLYTEEVESFTAGADGPISSDSAVTDNIFEFRQAEIDGSRCQTFTILKTRESSHDSTIRMIEFTDNGIRLGAHVEFSKSYLPVVKRKMT